MPVNFDEIKKTPSYKPSKEDAQLVLDLMERIEDLRTHRANIDANPYDTSSKARTIEDTWDYCDHKANPHKYSHPEMQPWMADNSHPLIMAKIDTALGILISKNPEIEISGKEEVFEKKSKVLEALYNLSWDKGEGRQKLISFAENMARYGTAIGREYHRYRKITKKEIIKYDPEGKHETKEKEVVIHDEPYFEVLPIRDCYFDNRARPYDEDSIRDWCWCVEYDMSTFQKDFKKYPAAKFVMESTKDIEDKAEPSVIGRPTVKVWFYENKENDEFLVTDGLVLIHKGSLLNNELSCVIGMWKKRNDFTIYGLSLPEMLESSANSIDSLHNMTTNQLHLSIMKSGYYGGSGTLSQSDMIMEPKLKKLRDAEKIVWSDVPTPSGMVMDLIEDLRNEADESSGVTKALGGEQVGKTLGEAVLNKEAGLRRMALPLQNLEFALERHARLRVDNIQRIYSRPDKTDVVMNDMGTVVDEKLWKEYTEERAKGSEKLGFIEKFPSDNETGEVFRNQFKNERLPLEKTEEGESEASEKDVWLEITPEEIRGDFDVKIKAMSTIPLSQTLEASKALETFNIIAQLPDTDLNSAERRMLKARGEDPDQWMKSEEDVIQTQEDAQGGMPGAEGGQPPPQGGAPKQVPPAQLEKPAAGGGISSQVSNALK